MEHDTYLSTHITEKGALITAFPCEVKEGNIFYVVKLSEEADPIVVCQQKVEIDHCAH
jgi:hypothetical protein